jgi:hypothetical protein
MLKLIVYHNLNDNTYYYKLVRGRYTKYYVGYINQYNHEIVLLIPDLKKVEFLKENHYWEEVQRDGNVRNRRRNWYSIIRRH